ncbi:MAG: GtrA family protein [Gammaproteobacteria bacterium]|nr:GtrA family protein [Gammaproteobacteria bacterium]
MSKAGHKEFLQFLFVGGIAAFINFISRIGFNEFVNYRVAVVLAYIVGMIVAFTLFKYYVFEKSGKHYIDEVKNFTIVNILGIVQVWFISIGLAEYFFPYISLTFYPYEIAHFIGLCVPAISSYFGHKHFSFKKTS